MPSRKAGRRGGARFSGAAVNCLPGVFCLIDERGRFLRWNQNFERVTGYTAAEVARMRPFDFVPDEEQSALRSQFAGAFETGELSAEVSLVSKGGGRAPYFFTGRRVLFDGAPCVAGTGVEAAGRRRAQDASREGEAGLRRLVESDVVGAFIADSRGNISLANDAFLQLTGYSRKDLREGRISWGALTPPEYRAQDERAVAELLATGKSRPFEKEFINKDGGRVPVLAGVARLEDGKDDRIAFILDLTERKRVEEALRESRNRLRLVTDSVPVMIVYCDGEQRYRYVNKPYVERFGITPREVIGRRISEVLGDAAYADIRQYVEAVLEGRPVEFEVEMTYERIGIRHMHCNYVPDVGDGGSVKGFYALIRDVTERRRMSEKLSRRESLFRALIENSTEAVSLLGRDFQILYASSAAERVLGYGHEEFVGLDALSLLHPDELSQVVKSLSEWMENRGAPPYTVLARLRHKDGRWCWLEGVFTNMLDKPSVGAVVVNYRDVTGRKQAEEELRHSQLLFRSVVDNSPSLIYVKDPEGHILLANRQLAEVVGRPREFFVGKTTHDLLDKETADLHWANDLHVLQTGRPLVTEETNSQADGLHTYYSVKFPLLGEDGRPYAVGGISTDISEVKRAERQLIESREQLRSLTARLHEVREEERIHLAREVHDVLGQMLTALKMDLSACARHFSKQLGEADQAAFAESATALDELTSLICKTVQHISAELRPGVLDTLGLPAAIEWQAHDFESRHGIACRAEVGENGLDLSSQKATAVFRIFQEVLTNVLRHARARSVAVALRARGGQLVLEVADDGRGITKEELSATSSLGLLGMRERAGAFGGAVRISGRRGRGTRVVLTMPLGGD